MIRNIMKKRQLFLLLLAAALFSCATADRGAGGIPSLDEAIEQSAADIAAKLPQGTRVAIAAFESPEQNLSGYIMDEIAGALADSSLEVADRNNLDYVYKELDLQTSGEVSDRNAQEIGKFLAARYVITGQLVNLGGRYRYRLNGINVQTAIHESSTRLDVRDDRNFETMLAALRDAAPVVRTASYGAGKPPQTPGRFLDRGITFASRGEYGMAIADFTQAINLDPDMQAAWMLRGRALYASVSRVTGVDENFSGVSTEFVSGAAVTEEKKAVYDRAIADFTQAIRLDPDSASAYIERGGAYDAKGYHDQAIADYSQAIRLAPDYYSAYSVRGLAYSEKGDYDRAIADYSQAIRLNPDYSRAYSNRGNAYNHKGEYDRAIDNYNQAIRLNPNDATALYNRGVAYNNKGEYDKAITDYNRAIRFNPNFAEAYHNRAFAYINKEDYDRAIADYNQAIRLDPNDAKAYTDRGRLYAIKNDDRAIADYTQAIRLDPDYSRAYALRGLYYYSKNDYDKAIADFNQAVRLDPNDAVSYNFRGHSYGRKGDYDRAITDHTQSIRINPNYADAYAGRGFSYVMKNDYVHARTDWEKALQLDPNNADTRENLERLRGMGY
jgi:tetratricopeptide (TPR) repeat protein